MESTKVLTYTAIFEKSPKGGYVAYVPMLPGCMTQGETFEEAKANVRDAIAGYVEVLDMWRCSRKMAMMCLWRVKNILPQTQRIAVIPFHAREIKRGLLFGILKQAGVTHEQLISVL